MGNHYVVTALGKKLDMTTLRDQNKNVTPVGRKINKTISKTTEVKQITPVAAKLNAVTPSNNPVSTNILNTAKTDHSETSPHKKGKK